MPCFTLAAAQYPAAAADIACNLERHLEFVAQAAEQQVQLLVFPELSLSGYELADAAEDRVLLGRGLEEMHKPLAAAEVADRGVRERSLASRRRLALCRPPAGPC